VRTIRLDIAYDGTDFRGWARQRDPLIRTVEGALSEVLEYVMREDVRLSVAGRTDAGVHARGQVASFVTESDLATERIRDAVNGALAPEVVVIDARVAPEGFDARFSATARVYRYVIETADPEDPFLARYTWHRPGSLSIPRMRAAARLLVGEHDFASFCRHPGPGRSTVRDLQRVSIVRDGSRVSLSFRANAFLHQMVRSLVGSLVAVGDRRLEPAELHRVLLGRDRALARGVLAPAKGLTLERVIYGSRA
jgi:tRNA pseudouridine38-40 synthase